MPSALNPETHDALADVASPQLAVPPAQRNTPRAEREHAPLADLAHSYKRLGLSRCERRVELDGAAGQHLAILLTQVGVPTHVLPGAGWCCECEGDDGRCDELPHENPLSGCVARGTMSRPAPKVKRRGLGELLRNLRPRLRGAYS